MQERDLESVAEKSKKLKRKKKSKEEQRKEKRKKPERMCDQKGECQTATFLLHPFCNLAHICPA
jgi:hypothetical protein